MSEELFWFQTHLFAYILLPSWTPAAYWGRERITSNTLAHL